MKITVIIPTYKPKDYLWECLDSLVEQTFPRDCFEVIIVLNGCREPWKTEIDDYIATKMNEMNITFIQTSQGGVSNARNMALDIAKGEYITFLDDDDYISPNFLSGLYEKAAKDVVVLSYPFAFNDIDKHTQLPYIVTSEYEKVCDRGKVNYKNARRYFGGPCMKLIPSECINSRRYDLKYKNGEDSLFMFLISNEFRFVKTAGRESIYYRRYRENSAYTKKQNWMSVAKNGCNLAREYTKIYLSNFPKYSFYFYLTRLLGVLKTIVTL